jgi:hypothetical protein
MPLFQALSAQRQTRKLTLKGKALPQWQRFFCLCIFCFTTLVSSTTLMVLIKVAPGNAYILDKQYE